VVISHKFQSYGPIPDVKTDRYKISTPNKTSKEEDDLYADALQIR
jgi:hypothetical protein